MLILGIQVFLAASTAYLWHLLETLVYLITGLMAQTASLGIWIQRSWGCLYNSWMYVDHTNHYQTLSKLVLHTCSFISHSWIELKKSAETVFGTKQPHHNKGDSEANTCTLQCWKGRTCLASVAATCTTYSTWKWKALAWDMLHDHYD